jgi:hypothetical protein
MGLTLAIDGSLLDAEISQRIFRNLALADELVAGRTLVADRGGLGVPFGSDGLGLVEQDDAGLEVIEVRLFGDQVRVDISGPAGHCQIAGQRMLEVGAAQKAVDPDRVERHQDGHQSHQCGPQRAGTVTTEPCDSGELAQLEGDAEADDGQCRAGEDAGQVGDREEDNDIFVVVTCLSPDKYAELNVIGQWLEIPDIISEYYQDQINQSAGRNRGFRQSSDRETKTTLITSRLWKSVLSKLSECNPRVQLYESVDRP